MQNNSLEYLKRTALWFYLLLKSLLAYWIGHPQNTVSIFRFLIKKLIYIPKFTKRNVMTESQKYNYEENLETTKNIYNKYAPKVNFKNRSSYKLLKKILKDKEQILYFLVRKYKPTVVLETGVAAGVSSGFILQALNDNKKGSLYSIDLPFQWYTYGNNELHLDSLPPGQNSGYLVPNKLRNRWRLTLGDTYQELPKLVKKLRKINIFFHDSEHTFKTMTFEYNQTWSHLPKKGLLLSDDVNFTTAFNKFVRGKKVKYFVFKKIGIAIK